MSKINEAFETTWYVFPGQDINKTKTQELGKALIIKKAGWEQLMAHLDKDQNQANIQQEEEDRKKYLKEVSHAMTKNWDNSIEVIIIIFRLNYLKSSIK